MGGNCGVILNVNAQAPAYGHLDNCLGMRRSGRNKTDGL